MALGLDSQAIKDVLDLNPINTAISVLLGLKHMLDNTYQYIKEGDIVVVILECNNLSTDYTNDYPDLTRMILDVDTSKIRLLDLSQILKSIRFIPDIIRSKLDTKEYATVTEEDKENNNVNSFNEYGDATFHWTLGRI